MPFYGIEAIAYDKDGKRLNGNTHRIEASSQHDAIEIAKSRQNNTVGTVRIEAKVLYVSDEPLAEFKMIFGICLKGA